MSLVKSFSLYVFIYADVRIDALLTPKDKSNKMEDNFAGQMLFPFELTLLMFVQSKYPYKQNISIL